MSMLLERVKAAQPAENGHVQANVLADADCAPADPFADVKERIYQRMLREIDPEKITNRDKREVRPEIQNMAANMLTMDDVPMARDERLRCATDIADEIV